MQESVGYALTEGTRASIQSVDLTAASRVPAKAVLILDREDRAPSEAWRAHLRGLGATVERLTLPGYVEMMLDPHHAQPPTAMLEVFRGWLDREMPRAATEVRAVPVSSMALRVAPGVLEEPVFLEETQTVFGMVSRPDGGAAPRRAIVLVNSGALHHTGPNRLWVRLARRWAARGALVLRVDLAGIGDSAPWPGGAENVVYPAEHDRSLVAVMHYLRAAGLATVHGAGVCSGAYHLVKAAGAGHPFTSVVAINPLVFYWKDGMSLDYPRHLVAETAAQHKRSMLQWDKWRKLLTGGVDLIALANVWGRHAARSATAWSRNLARMTGRPLVEDVGADIGAIVRRGVALHFVFSEGEPGEGLLRSGGGWALERMTRTGAVRIDHLQGPDHTFTPMWTQDVLAALLETDFGLA